MLRGVLKAAIIAGGSYNGPYDLFLAANSDAPADLVYRIGFNPLHSRIFGGSE